MDVAKWELPLTYAAPAVLTAALWYAALFWWRRQRIPSPPLPPGPVGLPLLGSLPFLDPDLHSYFAGLAKTYGPILSIRLGTKLAVVVSSPALAREVLREQDKTFANRDVPAVARVLAYGGSDIVWTPDGPVMRMLRKVCVREVLGAPSLDAVYPMRRREVRATVRHLHSQSGKAVDVGAQLFLTSMNMVTEMLWGGELAEEGKEVGGGGGGRAGLAAEFRELVGEMTRLLGMPNLSDFLPAAMERWDLQGLQRRMKGLQLRFDEIFLKIIDQRRRRGGESGHGGGKNFLEFLLRLEEEGGDGKTPFTMTHVKALLMDMVVGGTDTTSNTVEWAMAEMMRKPETLRKAQEELDAVVGKDNVVEESHVPKLSYLAAVMKEVLRLHPPLPLMVNHCPSVSTTVGGYSVPKGSQVFVNVWAIHRDPSIWEDPLEFRPDRFLGASAGGATGDFSGNSFEYIPFGSGRRMCAGVAMAERVFMHLLASLVHSFHWRLPEGTKLDMSEKFGIVVKKATPLVAIPVPRLADPELYS